MFWTILRFEVTYHRRQPTTYLYFATLFLLAFFAMASSAVVVTGGTGQVMKNAPYALAESMTALTAIGQVITTAIVGTAILRDFNTKSHELLFTTRLTRIGYLGGRFVGATLAMIAIFAAIPLGGLVGTVMPWMDPDKLQPFHLSTYVEPFLVFVVPNVLFLAALFFAVGALTRQLFAIYAQGIVLLMVYLLSQQILGTPDRLALAGLADPFGIAAIDLATRYWTVADKNARLLPLTGVVLWNRLLWLAVAGAIAAVALALVRLDVSPRRLTLPRWRRSANHAADAALDRGATAHDALLRVPQPTLRFDWRARLGELTGATAFYFRSIVREPVFVTIAVISGAYVVLVAANQAQDYGTPIWPVTAEMTRAIRDALLVMIIILATLYAGELAWRERQLRAHGTVDALPVPTGTILAAKITAFLGAMGVVLCIALAAGVGVQTAAGYHRYELGLYAATLVGILYPVIVQLTLLAFLVHALVNNKAVGHVVMIVYFVLTIVLSNLGFQRVIYRYGFIPRYVYSDMNGFAHYVPAISWVLAYYTALALGLGVVTYLAWVRGSDEGLNARWRTARARWRSSVTRAAAGSTACAALATGAVVLYNTAVLNPYASTKDVEQQRAAYERSYRRFKDIAHPRVLAVRIRADLVPEHRTFALQSVYRLVNEEPRALDTLFVSVPAVAFNGTVSGEVSAAHGFHVDSIRWNRPTMVLFADSVRGVYLYRPTTPIAPGDTLTLAFGGHFQTHGFPNDHPNDDIAANGTFLTNSYFPGVSYNDAIELTDDDQRKAQGLPRQSGLPSLDSVAATRVSAAGRDGDWITFDAVVSTAPDQIAIAPGYLQREWIEGNRRVFAYHMDVPIVNFYSIQSGRYRVRHDQHNGVAIDVYYHPGHEFNIDQMVDATKRGLDYYTANFSPYQFRQFRIVEFPRYQAFAQSFPTTVPFSEGIGFIARVSDTTADLDWPFFVTAHELSHQWWGNQLLPAGVQGATMLVESLAEYSALTVMERKVGAIRSQRFLRIELDRYLRGRGTERRREVPLMYVDNQPYIHYSKGALALYALRDYIGEDSLNTALRRFLRDRAFQRHPSFPTTRDFLGYLRAVTPDSLQYVIHDLFETITLYDNKATAATARKRPDGSYVVNITIEARKIRADSLGNETTIPIADYIDVGVFGAPDPGNTLGKPLSVWKIRVTSPVTNVAVIVPERPYIAGVDPYNKLIDRTPEDNVRQVAIETPPSRVASGAGSVADSK